MDTSELELFARCASGFEAVLAQELKDLGMRRVRPLHGGVAFFGTQADAYTACLWSRVATRIQLVLARVPATDADELYQQTVAFRWERHVRDGATIAVDAHGTNANLRNTQFTALKVKDALCDRLRQVRGARPNVDAKQPDFQVNVALHEERATLYLNLSGESLHRRGYRQDGVQTEAPLKETLAAGILLSAGWDALAAEGGVLVDPMCGSGTFAIEGALIARGVAPGIFRPRWGFEGWVRHDHQLWQELLEDARLRQEGAWTAARIIAGDLNAQAVQIAQANASRAGVEGLVKPYVDDAVHLARHLRGVRGASCLMVANPPYGLRLLSQAELPAVHQALAAAVDALPKDARVALVTPDLGIDTALGRVPDQVTACYNGPIEAWVRLYDLQGSAPFERQVVSLRGANRSVRLASPESEQFAGRLRKVGKERARWARREGVENYRVYDADLPDYPLVVDVYQGAGPDEGHTFAVVEERPRPRSVDVQRAGRHFADAVALTSALLDVPVEDVVQKPWATDALYQRTREATPARWVCVAEDGCLIDVDLAGAMGKQLPPDLRLVRAFVGEHAAGVRFANLFVSGGAATLRAADGGATSTVTVDVSQDRLDWVAQGLRKNGAPTRRNEVVCSDVRTWLQRAARAGQRFGLMLCSPPERLAAHGKQGSAWDVEQDLVPLLGQIGKVLTDDGLLVLVLPAGVPMPNEAQVKRCGLTATDARQQLTSPDCARSRDAARCWLVRKTS